VVSTQCANKQHVAITAQYNKQNLFRSEQPFAVRRIFEPHI